MKPKKRRKNPGADRLRESLTAAALPPELANLAGIAKTALRFIASLEPPEPLKPMLLCTKCLDTDMPPNWKPGQLRRGEFQVLGDSAQFKFCPFCGGPLRLYGDGVIDVEFSEPRLLAGPEKEPKR